MISKNIIEFLELLRDNNNREWFNSNKSTYTKVKAEFEAYTKVLISNISVFDRRIAYIEPKECIFRILRDVRFTKDKLPYKTNFGAYITKGGRKSGYAGYYLHLQAGGSFIAGGIYMPEPSNLKAVRQGIVDNIDEFLKIINQKSFIKYFGKISGDKNIKAPSGFDKNFPHVDLIKFKSYNLIYNLDNKALTSKSFDKQIVNIFKEMYNFNAFINKCIEEV